MIQINHVSINYKENNNECLAINDVSLAIESGSFTSIVGRSGSGKTSLLNALGGLLLPTKGEVLVDGEDIYQLSDVKLAEYRSTHIGYIFQDFYLEGQYSVQQNLEIVLMITGYPVTKRKKKIAELLERVGLEGRQKQRTATLSGGERQRICIARALANNPQIILADEPCGNLDSYNGAIIMEYLQEFSQEGKTVVLVTHNMEDAGKTDRIIELKDGVVMRDERN